MDSILKKILDRINRIFRFFLFPVSGRNRKYTIRFAEWSHYHDQCIVVIIIYWILFIL